MRTMKSLLIIFALAAALAVPMQGQASDLGALRMSYLEGDVQINNEETGEWVPASANMPLRPGDRLWVPSDGRAEVQSRSGTIIRLDRNTSADILRIEDHSSQFNVNSGAAYVNFGDSDDFMQIDTPISSIRINNKSKLNIGVAESGNTNVMVFTGKVSVEDRGGITDMKSREALVLTSDQGARLYDMPLADDWDRWNLSRDKMYSADSRGSQYLPDDLRSYSRDLDDNGRWVDVKDYGWVWTPRTVVAVDWAPYRTGRWVWMGGDYVWVSYEPWGWAPYHYGRWAYSPAVGWFWVPPRRGNVYWGPGYVGWVRTSTYVSWVPLAPGEIYYGRGHYGQHSVNVTNVNVNVYKTVNIYKNVNVNNSVTVVNHQSFVSGNYKREKFDRNRYFNERISAGSPNIAPTKASRMPIIKQIRSDRMPPGHIRQINIERVKEDRKLVRDRDVSVMRPGARPEKRRIETVSKPLDRQEIKRGRHSDEQTLKSGRDRYIQPVQKDASKDDGRIKQGDSVDRSKRSDQGDKGNWDRRRPVDDQKTPSLRPESDTRKKDLPNRDSGRIEMQQRPTPDRFDRRRESSHGPSPADKNRELRPAGAVPQDTGVQGGKKHDERIAPVKPRDEKAPSESRQNLRGRPAYQDPGRPVQQRDKAVTDRHQNPPSPQKENIRQEKNGKPEKEAGKEHRDNIKDEGDGRRGK